MDAFASVISNNLNIVMKFLASTTIVMAIPTMISGLFGMNVLVPWNEAITPYGFWYILGLIGAISLVTIFVLKRKDLF
jgi:magnesium transporter